MNTKGESIRLVEVGPRDGLQNEKKSIDLSTKKELIEHLIQAGIKYIEAGAFVSPIKVPQMADSLALCQSLNIKKDIIYSALVPNLQGLEACLKTPVQQIGLLTTASESFCQRNINCSIKESLERIEAIIAIARPKGLHIRGYISCVLGCPYEGRVRLAQVAPIATKLMRMGCDEISLGDTIGVGTPKAAQTLIQSLANELDISRLAIHFHDTYGQALANIYACLERGIRIIDSSIGGLGGCPYAKGATGNVATEDVVYMLEGLGFKTGIDLDLLCATSDWICTQLDRPTNSKVAQARQGS